MEFLVRIQVEFPAAMAEAERNGLIAAERERGRELVSGGRIKGIWRIPEGTDPPTRLENVGVWEARDEAELDELISSLPLSEWLSADVTPLADHPISQPSDD